MIFSLEALDAKHGDSLILHYGKTSDPQLIVIDGGPKGVFSSSLRPRLEELRDNRQPGGRLEIRMVMVSHIDEDHIVGILDLTKSMLKAKADGDPQKYRILTVWHNSFDDLVKKVKPASASAALPAPTGKDKVAKIVLASVGQGRTLRNDAIKLAIPLNQSVSDPILAPDDDKLKVKIGTDLTFTIIGPLQEQLDLLQNEWAKQIAVLKKQGKLKPAAMDAVAAEYVEKTASNLSSIVVFAESGGKTMLLTGDARGDYVRDGLEAAGIKKKGKTLKVDVMKVPHHGSVRNVAQDFFEDIIADHYVISADGKYDNPDKKTIQMLLAARGNTPYTIYMTNHVKRIDTLLAKDKPGKVKVVFAKKNGPVTSLCVDLGDPVPS
jgi:beta-lactamase superfamily II metal-dependent hydrolase